MVFVPIPAEQRGSQPESRIHSVAMSPVRRVGSISSSAVKDASTVGMAGSGNSDGSSDSSSDYESDSSEAESGAPNDGAMARSSSGRRALGVQGLTCLPGIALSAAHVLKDVAPGHRLEGRDGNHATETLPEPLPLLHREDAPRWVRRRVFVDEKPTVPWEPKGFYRTFGDTVTHALLEEIRVLEDELQGMEDSAEVESSGCGNGEVEAGLIYNPAVFGEDALLDPGGGSSAATFTSDT